MTSRPGEVTGTGDAPGHAGTVPLPAGFRIALHADTRELAPGLWRGGSPQRVLRVSVAGQRALDALRDAPVRDRLTGLVARRFVDAGLANPIAPSVARPDVTVVVPVYGRVTELDRCLASLGGGVPVVVVDDGSPDELGVRAVAAAHGARVLRSPRNAGPAAARNLGLAAVRTEFVAFVDSDTEPGAAWIGELAGQFADPLVAAVAPRITGLAPDTAAGRYTRARGSLDLGARADDVRTYGRVAYVPTAALLARTALLRAAGGFDVALRHGEDVDVVRRLTAAGHRVRYVPSVRLQHREPTDWVGLLSRRFRYGTSAAPLALRHPGSLAPLAVHPWYTAAVAGALARSPLVAVPALVGAVRRTRRALAAAGLPAQHVPRRVVDSLWQTTLGTGRYLHTFSLPVLLAALTRHRTRPAAAVLLLAPPLAEWCTRRPRLDPVRWCGAVLADDAAYGAGVIAGCLTHRTTAPLRPVRVR